MEFTVKMTCLSCVNKVDAVLKETSGVSRWEISLPTNQVFVSGSAHATDIQKALETKTGLKTVIGKEQTPDEPHLPEPVPEPVSRMEFAVQMTSISCVNKVATVLREIPGVLKWDINLPSHQVIVQGSASAVEIQKTLESKTKLKTIIRGQGAIDQNLGCAYTAIRERLANGIINENGKVIGVVRFVQLTPTQLLVEAEIDGLTPGLHGCHIHEFGDLSEGFKTLGEHYNPRSQLHGGPMSTIRHYGDLGNVTTDHKGRGRLRVILTDDEFNIWNLIGRSVCVKAGTDDLGKEQNDMSIVDGNSGEPLACGIIARSSGVFQNSKTICTCSGSTLWQSDPIDAYTA